MDLTSKQLYTFGDSIYFLSDAANWGEAQNEAKQHQGNLVTINNGTEQTFLAGLFAGRNLWIGYSDAGTEGKFQWADGEKSAYTNWAAGQPNNAFGAEDFTILTPNGNWNDVSGARNFQGIIEIKSSKTPILVAEDLGIVEPNSGNKKAVFTVQRFGNISDSTTVRFSTSDGTATAGNEYSSKAGRLTFKPGETTKKVKVNVNADADLVSGETFFLELSSPKNAILGTDQAKATISEATDTVTFEGSTYLLTNVGNWGEAQAQARAFGGNLVTINSAEEQAFLAGAYAGKQLWIGYSDAGKEYDPTTREGFEWVSGEKSAYTNWSTGQPNNAFGAEDFVVLTSSGSWNDVSGARSFQGIIEIPSSTSSSPSSIRVKGTDSIFLAGRDDVTIPALGQSHPSFPLRRHGRVRQDFKQETFPDALKVSGGESFKFKAKGSIDFYNGSTRPFKTPDGGNPNGSSLSSLGGISGYRGPSGALAGVFLNDKNPRRGKPPETLNFHSSGLGQEFNTLKPKLNQVFFIGDGFSSDGDQHRFVAPKKATRLFVGIPDGFGFRGSPGAYEDNNGKYKVSVQRTRRGSVRTLGSEDPIVGTDGQKTPADIKDFDLLLGKGNKDRFTGNEGRDRVIYESPGDRGNRVLNFETGIDKIDVSALPDSERADEGYLSFRSLGNNNSGVCFDSDGITGNSRRQGIVSVNDVNLTELSDVSNFII